MMTLILPKLKFIFLVWYFSDKVDYDYIENHLLSSSHILFGVLSHFIPPQCFLCYHYCKGNSSTRNIEKVTRRIGDKIHYVKHALF